jgi:hypothetical protein
VDSRPAARLSKTAGVPLFQEHGELEVHEAWGARCRGKGGSPGKSRGEIGEPGATWGVGLHTVGVDAIQGLKAG